MKKTTLTLATLATTIAPVATILSCGTKKENMSKIVTLQAQDDGALKMYKKIVEEFKKDDDMKKLMKARGITDIKVIKNGNAIGEIKTKGFKDEKSVADIMIVTGNEINAYIKEESLLPFSMTDETKLLQNIIGDSVAEWHTASAGTIKMGKIKENKFDINKKIYGIPQNIEAMVGLTEEGKSATIKLTGFSDLWKAAGFFNTSTTNFKDIVMTKPDGNTSINEDTNVSKKGKTKTQWQAFLKTGFESIFGQIKNHQGTGDRKLKADMFAEKWDVYNPAVQNYFKTNTATAQYIDGPWAIKPLKKLLGSNKKIKSETIANYNQWVGGSLFGLNSRITRDEQAIAEKLIGFLLKDKYAKETFSEMGKLSPIKKGSEQLTKDTTNKLPSQSGWVGTETTKMAKAIYETNSLDRPSDNAFGIVWGVYAKVVGAFKAKLAAVTSSTAYNTVKVDSKTMDELFMSNLEAAIIAANQG